MFNLIETFSGIGSQAQALKNIGIDLNVQAISEWDVAAIYAYDIMHHGEQNISIYRHHTKHSILEELEKYNISNDGVPTNLKFMNTYSLKKLLFSIERSNNLVDITRLSANDFPDETDLLTYSFPCQDLSIAGRFHNNNGGIDRDANNQSTLLWEIERILKEYYNTGKAMPRFLLMENVNAILAPEHIDNFNEWEYQLESLGYINQVWTLDARNFGVPQSRIRTYMLSVLVNEETKEIVQNIFEDYNLESILLDEDQINPLSNYLKLEYSSDKYKNEAIESTPVFTPSRKKIYIENPTLAIDNQVTEKFARTITTKQDRHPNSGIIKYDQIKLIDHNTKYRNLTPRECFLLMGFDESQFDLLAENNIKTGKDKYFLSNSRLIKMAGNSIVVAVLETIFKYMLNIESFVLEEQFNYPIPEIQMQDEKN